MSEFIRDYGFFFVVAVLMLFCHLEHGSHGGKGRDEDGKGPGGGHPH
jgi:hypothetical protein